MSIYSFFLKTISMRLISSLISNFYLFTSISLYLQLSLSFFPSYLDISVVAVPGCKEAINDSLKKERKKKVMLHKQNFPARCKLLYAYTHIFNCHLIVLSLFYLVHSCNIEKSDPLVLYIC